MPGEVGGDEHGLPDGAGRRVRGEAVEIARVVEVPGEGRFDESVTPLIAARSRAPRRRSRPSSGAPAVRSVRARRPPGTPRTTSRRASGGWATVIRPSAQPAAHAAVSGPTAAPNSGGGDSGRDQSRARCDGDPAVVRHDFSPSSSRRSTVDRLLEPRLALLLGRPRVAGDVLVDRLTAAERGPEPVREHLGERRDRLRDDRRVVALAGRRDDAEREGCRGERGAEPAPGEARSDLGARSRARNGRSTWRRRTPPVPRAARPGGGCGDRVVRGRRGSRRSSRASLRRLQPSEGGRSAARGWRRDRG